MLLSFINKNVIEVNIGKLIRQTRSSHKLRFTLSYFLPRLDTRKCDVGIMKQSSKFPCGYINFCRYRCIHDTTQHIRYALADAHRNPSDSDICVYRYKVNTINNETVTISFLTTLHNRYLRCFPTCSINADHMTTDRPYRQLLFNKIVKIRRINCICIYTSPRIPTPPTQCSRYAKAETIRLIVIWSVCLCVTFSNR